MRSLHDIAFFGPSLVSAYWNSAATYYRGLIRELASRPAAPVARTAPTPAAGNVAVVQASA